LSQNVHIKLKKDTEQRGNNTVIKMFVHAAGQDDTYCTWVNRRSQLKAEQQLATNMICWQPATQGITHNPIPADERWRQTGDKINTEAGKEENGRTENTLIITSLIIESTITKI